MDHEVQPSRHRLPVGRVAASAIAALFVLLCVPCILAIIDRPGILSVVVCVPATVLFLGLAFPLLRIARRPQIYDTIVDNHGIQTGVPPFATHLPWHQVESIQARFIGWLCVKGPTATLTLPYELTNFQGLVETLIANTSKSSGPTEYREQRGDWNRLQIFLVVMVLLGAAAWLAQTAVREGVVIAAMTVILAVKLLRDDYRHGQRIAISPEQIVVEGRSWRKVWDPREISRMILVRNNIGVPAIHFEVDDQAWTLSSLNRTNWLELYACMREVARVPFDVEEAGQQADGD